MIAFEVFRSAFLVGRRDAAVFWSSWRVWLLAWVLRVTTTATMWVLLGRMIGSDELLRFLLIGQAVMSGPQSTGFVVAASAWDRMQGTYPQLVVAPSSLVPAMLGRTFVWLLNAIATSALTFLVLLPLFGIPIAPSAVPLLALAIVVVCLSGYGFALFLGCWVVRVPRVRNLVHNLASVVIIAISGVVVPVTFWPEWVASLASVLPVSHALAGVRLLFDGAPAADVLGLLSLELLVAGGWLAVATLLMDRMAEIGRRDGSIEVAVG